MSNTKTTKDTGRVSPIYLRNNPYRRVGKADQFYKASNAQASPVIVVYSAKPK